MTWKCKGGRELAADKAERAPISQSRGKRGVVGLELCLRQKLKVEVARSESSYVGFLVKIPVISICHGCLC